MAEKSQLEKLYVFVDRGKYNEIHAFGNGDQNPK